jgi:D-alanyl-D-alanine carboxypeptidase/D-alanyl-D-alanine-endopeptidase (penicillin-binding protein 4)
VTRRAPVGLALAGVACAAGAVFLLASLRPAPAHPIADAAPQVRTPLWSPRRVPGLLIRTIESAARARAGDALTKQLATIIAPVHACVAVDGSLGSLARLGDDLALAPASTMKLLTATTAIDLLGPDHRFTTRVLTDSAGDLVVVGGGDPLLATPEHIVYEHSQPAYRNAPFTPLTALADAVVAAGVHNVSGALLVDDHAHETLRFLPAWKPIYAREGDVGSLGALTVDGGYADTGDRTPAPDPALTTGQRLATMLAARGVTITGGVRRGLAPTSTHEVAHVDSPPLSSVVGEMLTSSDNYTAEELLRDLAVGAAGGAPATTELGTRLVAHELDVLGVSRTGLVMHDGSGLAPDDRVRCTTMLRLIELATQPKFAAIDLGLAIAGRSGTLAERFLADPLAGKLRAKTGSIAGVVGLVGVIDGLDDLRFAFLANGEFSAGAGAALQAEVARAVASTPDLRAPPDLVPRP